MTILMIGAPEIIFIVLIVLLLFGGKKIPELMRGLGKGVKFFKEGMKEGEDEVKNIIHSDDKPTQEDNGAKQE